MPEPTGLVSPTPAEDRRTQRGFAMYAIGLAMLPLLFLLWKLSLIGHNFPYWDAWELVPLMQRWDAGVLGFADLWAQHNEHRILFPRIILMGIAYATGWDTRYDVALSVFCAGVLVLALSYCALRAPADRTLTPPWWTVPVFSFLIFSWTQMENWIWGWQSMIFLSTAAVGVGFVLLTGDTKWHFGGAVALGVLATFSFANGLIYWLAAAPVLAFAGDLSPRTRTRRALWWAVVGAACIAAYMYGYTKPGSSPEMATPQAIVAYVVLFLGAPVTAVFTRVPWHGDLLFPVQWWWYLPGGAGLLAAAWVMLKLWRERQVDTGRLSPWLALILFAGASAVVTAVGRAGYGLGQALTSSYISIGLLYWCGLTGLVALWLQPRQVLTLASPSRQSAVLGGGALLLVAALAGTSRANAEWEQVARWRHMGWEAIRSGNHAPLLLQDICHHPDVLREDYLPWLAARGWAGLGADARPLAYSAADYRAEVRGFIEGGQSGPAQVYLDTAEHLEPNAPENAALRDLGRARFQTSPTP